ncbi:hypothetical protein HYQ46_000653 [Verticillium longisporum]|nr:hypothetical protein HYQ46_000653 [Verticillium longisporum]
MAHISGKSNWQRRTEDAEEALLTIKSRLHHMRALLSNLSRLTMQGGLQSHSAVNEETLAAPCGGRYVVGHLEMCADASFRSDPGYTKRVLLLFPYNGLVEKLNRCGSS